MDPRHKSAAATPPGPPRTIESGSKGFSFEPFEVGRRSMRDGDSNDFRKLVSVIGEDGGFDARIQRGPGLDCYRDLLSSFAQFPVILASDTLTLRVHRRSRRRPTLPSPEHAPD